MLLLIGFEFLACFFIWWAGAAVVLGKEPEHRDLDMAERERRREWVVNELAQRPWWWLMLSGLAFIVLFDWFMTRWERPRWRSAALWTIAMVIVLAVIMALTVHFGWGMRAVHI